MKEKISESSTVGYCSSDYASTSTLTTINGYWGGISTTDNAPITSDGTTAVRNLLPDLNSTKKKVVEGIMDGVMELDSLVDDGATETYDITDITFKERKTRFTCRKEVDLEYAGRLKRRTELLLEFTPIQVDDHKKRAIEHSEGSVLVSGTGIVTTTTDSPLTWTYVPGNVTYGTNAITISADGLSTTGNINYA